MSRWNPERMEDVHRPAGAPPNRWRAMAAAAAREAAIRRQARRDALARPFRMIAGLLRRKNIERIDPPKP